MKLFNAVRLLFVFFLCFAYQATSSSMVRQNESMPRNLRRHRALYKSVLKEMEQSRPRVDNFLRPPNKKLSMEGVSQNTIYSRNKFKYFHRKKRVLPSVLEGNEQQEVSRRKSKTRKVRAQAEDRILFSPREFKHTKKVEKVIYV